MLKINSNVVLEDVLAENLRMVVCGTAVGNETARRGMYYANSGNKFWSMLFEVGITDRLLGCGEYMFLPQYSIGLTDLIKDQYGNDTDISFSANTNLDLQIKMLRYKPLILCFNGKKAAEQYFNVKKVSYGLLKDNIGQTQIFIAPSTSGSGCRYWDIDVWKEAARLCGYTPR